MKQPKVHEHFPGSRSCSRVEVQVRTEAMEYVATHGSAAHKDYFTSQFSFLEPTPETPSAAGAGFPRRASGGGPCFWLVQL